MMPPREMYLFQFQPVEKTEQIIGETFNGSNAVVVRRPGPATTTVVRHQHPKSLGEFPPLQPPGLHGTGETADQHHRITTARLFIIDLERVLSIERFYIGHLSV
jgi:hypothetical protein